MLFKKVFVLLDELWIGRVRAAIDDHLVVGRKERTAVVARLIGQPANVLAVRVHRVKLEVAVTLASEDDLFTIRRDGRLGVVTGRVCQVLYVLAVRCCSVDLIIRIDGPDVAVLSKVRWRRALTRSAMRRRIEHLLAVLEKVRARRASFAVRDLLHVRPVDIHPIDTVARVAVALRLKDQLLSIGGEIGLSILAGECQLLEIAQVRFSG